MITSRGIRNNNPGNIRISNEKWQGLAELQTDSSFFVFKTPEYGIRALVKILRTYQNRYGLKDIRSIINRFAPPCENDTESYIKSVCRVLGVSDSEHINVYENWIMINLLRAIIRHENGSQPYSDEQLLEGIKLADE